MNAPAPAGALTVATIKLTDITPSPTNPRQSVTDEYLNGLAATIRQHGVIHPITVRANPKGKPLYEIVVGECRWRASKIAGYADIPAFFRPLTDPEVLAYQLIENLQREDVNAIEEAEGFARLMKECSLSAEAIAAQVGKSKAYVYASVKLTALCKQGREAVITGKIDPSIGLLIARVPGEKLQKEALAEIVSPAYQQGPLSHRAAKELLQRKYMISLKQATFSLKDANLVASAGSCEKCPERTGNNPEIFGDVGDANVCTKPACFESKRLARHEQLIADAEANRIPVLRGREANKVMPRGIWSIDTDDYVPLDLICDDDPKGRTYRQILGATTPVAAIVEGKGDRGPELVEVVKPEDISDALKKALKVAGKSPATAEERAEREAEEAQEAEREAMAKAENLYRAKLIKKVTGSLASFALDPANMTPCLRTLASAALLREVDWNNEFSDAAVAGMGYPLPDSYDPEKEAPKVIAWLHQQPPEIALSYLFWDFVVEDQRTVGEWCFRDADAAARVQTPLLSLFADMLGIDWKAMRPTLPENLRVDDEPLTVGDRVKVKANARGADGKKRKCCGRDGVIEDIQDDDEDDTIHHVRFGDKAHEIVTNLKRRELEKLQASIAETPPDPTQAAQAGDKAATKPAAPAKGKKTAPAKPAKAKADPAPAAPAKEPAKPAKAKASESAAPVETKSQPWPFPTSSKPQVQA